MMQTLVLDRAYRPHRIVPWERAIALLFGDKIEVLEEYDEEIRSVSLTIRMPAVVRLKWNGRKKPRPPRFSRWNVLARDGFACQYCAAKPPVRDLTFDHVVPRSQGGRSTWDNVVIACRACNTKKGGRTPEQAGMPLARRPTQPRSLPEVAFHVNLASIPDAWRTWLYWNGVLEQG